MCHGVYLTVCLSVFSVFVGVPYLRESDEVWWREGRKEDGEPSQEELNQFLGFSQVFKMIVDSVSNPEIRSLTDCMFTMWIP